MYTLVYSQVGRFVEEGVPIQRFLEIIENAKASWSMIEPALEEAIQEASKNALIETTATEAKLKTLQQEARQVSTDEKDFSRQLLENEIKATKQYLESLSSIIFFLDKALGNTNNRDFFSKHCASALAEIKKNPLIKTSDVTAIRLIANDTLFFKCSQYLNQTRIAQERGLLRTIKILQTKSSIEYLKGIFDLFFCQKDSSLELFQHLKAILSNIVHCINPRLIDDLEGWFTPVLTHDAAYYQGKVNIPDQLTAVQRRQFNREFFALLHKMLGLPVPLDPESTQTTPKHHRKSFDALQMVLDELARRKVPQRLAQALVLMLLQGEYKVYSVAYDKVLAALAEKSICLSSFTNGTIKGEAILSVENTLEGTKVTIVVTRDLSNPCFTAAADNKSLGIDSTPSVHASMVTTLKYSEMAPLEVEVSCSATFWQLIDDPELAKAFQQIAHELANVPKQTVQLNFVSAQPEASPIELAYTPSPHPPRRQCQPLSPFFSGLEVEEQLCSDTQRWEASNAAKVSPDPDTTNSESNSYCCPTPPISVPPTPSSAPGSAGSVEKALERQLSQFLSPEGVRSPDTGLKTPQIPKASTAAKARRRLYSSQRLHTLGVPCDSSQEDFLSNQRTERESTPGTSGQPTP